MVLAKAEHGPKKYKIFPFDYEKRGIALLSKEQVFAKAKQRFEKFIKYIIFAYRGRTEARKIIKYLPLEGEKGNIHFVVKKHSKV